jgi:spermidine synthase
VTRAEDAGRAGHGPEGGIELLARESDGTAELALRRRGEVLELVVDGVFAMDTASTATEEALARLALERLRGTHLRVLVGGLGLGYTTATLLADGRVAAVEVVELHAPLGGWVRAGLVPRAAGLLDDPRVTVEVADVADVVPRRPHRSLDALLLDVDNGPGFLVHAGNTRVYAPPFLTAAARTLRRGGVLGVWSADPAPDLALALERACGACDEILLDVSRDGRRFTYAVYLATRTA